MLEQVDAQKKVMILWETGSCQDFWPSGESSPCWSGFAGRNGDSTRDLYWSNLLLKDCTPWKGLNLDKFVEYYLSWEGCHISTGEEFLLLRRSSDRNSM